MGNIQNSINQILGTATIGAGLYAQSPAGKRMAEIKTLKQKTSAVNKQVDEFYNKAGDIDVTSAEHLSKLSPGDREVFFNIVEQGRDIAKRRFEAQPTQENLQRMSNSINTGLSRQEYAAEIAHQHMTDEQIRIQAQKDIMNQRRVG